MEKVNTLELTVEQALELNAVLRFYNFLVSNYSSKETAKLFNGVALKDYLENNLKIK